MVALAEEAFALADIVSFTTASTRRYHLGYGRPERHRLTPGWIDVAALDRWHAAQNRTALRTQFGLKPGELLVCNIGTVSDRKGQHTFARAVDLLNRRYPELAARTRFILLGGRDTPFDTMLADALADLRLPNLSVHPETTDYLRYYLAADVFVCSSYEESSPRVVLEAMALRTPYPGVRRAGRARAGAPGPRGRAAARGRHRGVGGCSRPPARRPRNRSRFGGARPAPAWRKILQPRPSCRDIWRSLPK